MNYKEVESKLQGRNNLTRKQANNTYLVRCNGYLALRYHSTDVVKFYSDGKIVLDNGGWFTSTTKERINMGLPAGFHLSQVNGIWWLNGHKFQNGITITSQHTIAHAAIDNPKADRKLKQSVKAYALKCAEAIPLDKPSSGDCWQCSMITQTGDTLGDAVKDTSHIDSHIEEGYIVPSLVYHALKESGNTDFILSLVFNNPDKTMLDIAQDRVKTSVYRYILRRKGYAV